MANNEAKDAEKIMADSIKVHADNSIAKVTIKIRGKEIKVIKTGG